MQADSHSSLWKTEFSDSFFCHCLWVFSFLYEIFIAFWWRVDLYNIGSSSFGPSYWCNSGVILLRLKEFCLCNLSTEELLVQVKMAGRFPGSSVGLGRRLVAEGKQVRGWLYGLCCNGLSCSFQQTAVCMSKITPGVGFLGCQGPRRVRRVKIGPALHPRERRVLYLSVTFYGLYAMLLTGSVRSANVCRLLGSCLRWCGKGGGLVGSSFAEWFQVNIW